MEFGLIKSLGDDVGGTVLFTPTTFTVDTERSLKLPEDDGVVRRKPVFKRPEFQPDEQFTVLDPPVQAVGRPLIVTPILNWVSVFGMAAVPRSQLTSPISPVDPPIDTLLLEDPADPSRQLWIPRYRVATQPAPAGQGGSPRPMLEIAPAEDGSWTFTAVLEPFAAAELGDVSALTPVEHTVTISLRFQAGAEQRELGFDPPTFDVDRVRAVMRLPDVNQRDLLAEVLADASFNPQLVIRRVARIAVASGSNDQGQLYRQATQTIDGLEPRQPFAFAKDTYAWLYAQVTDPTRVSVAAQLRWVTHGDRPHRYYQDPINPEVFSHLPDAFKIARRDDTPRAPAMSVQLTAGSGDPETAQVTLEYLAQPVTDPERLVAAADELARYVPQERLPITFRVQQVASSRVHFSLTLPRTGTSRASGTTEGEPRVDVRGGIADVVTMGMADFRSVFDALSGGGSPVLFQGQLELSLGEGDADIEQIPFIARLNDLAGDVLLQAQTPHPDGGDGGVDVTVTNAIECPLRIGGIGADIVLAVGGPEASLPAHVEHDGGPEPIILAPGAALLVHVVPDEPPAADRARQAALSFTTLEPLPDRDLEWQAILDPSAPAVFTRTIAVRGAGQFDPPPGQAVDPDPVIAVLVEFEHGSTVELTPAQPDGDGTIRLPLADFVLNAEVDASYRYRVRRVRRQARPPMSDWIADTTSPLYPVLV
ncbi:MAG: hypothetical protein QOG63_17 [Thermoleophilaceae bacterium]|nr:hypothetical protein [Thermoleophilaceae bacterium]